MERSLIHFEKLSFFLIKTKSHKNDAHLIEDVKSIKIILCPFPGNDDAQQTLLAKWPAVYYA